MTIMIWFGDICIQYDGGSDKVLLVSEDGEAMEVNRIKLQEMLKTFYRENF